MASATQMSNWASNINFSIDVLREDIAALGYGAGPQLLLASDIATSFEYILQRLETRLEAITCEVISLNREASLNDNSDLKVARIGFTLWDSVQRARAELNSVRAAGVRIRRDEANPSPFNTAEKRPILATRSLELKREPPIIQTATLDPVSGAEMAEVEKRRRKRTHFARCYVSAVIVVLIIGVVLVARLARTRA